MVSLLPGARQELPRGQTIDAVTCLTDASQSYSLYLPSTYAADRAWPVLIGFHPGARGRAIVDVYRAAAEQHGFIVAGSNNSRNGSWEVSGRAAAAVSQDLGQRFAVDPARVYLTGHSGGARVAMQLALTNAAIAGVIASSAGYPDARPRGSLRFPVFGTAGTDDFNYIEIRLLDRALKTPHRVAIFEGGHTLPPPAVAAEALAWLELQAMKTGRRPKDDGLVDRWIAERRATIAAAGDSAAAVRLLQDFVADFSGLRNVTAEIERASALARQPAIKRALDRDRDDVTAESRLLDEFVALEAGLRNEQTRHETLTELRGLLIDTHRKATSPTDSPTRDRSRRVLRIITMGAGERVQDGEYLKLIQQYRVR